MTKATEKILGDLHGKLAQQMIAVLESQTGALGLIAKYEGKLPGDVVMFLEKVAQPNPAFMTSVSKFLKDNEISVDPDTSEQMSDLEKLLNNKQDKKKTTPISDVPLH